MRTAWCGAGFVLLWMTACGGSTATEPTPAADAGQPDAPTMSDDGGSPQEDAAVADAADAGPMAFCASLTPAPVFCDDFDVGDLGKTWDFFLMSPPGDGVLDEAVVRSSPSAFLVTTALVNAAESGNILLRKSVVGAPARVRLNFDVFVPELPTSGAIAIATLDLSTDHLFTLYLRDDSASPAPALVEARPATSVLVRNDFAQIATKRWVHVEIDLKPGASVGSVRFDGTSVLDGIAIDTTVMDPTMRIGVLSYGPADPYVAHFDNVTLDYAP